MERAISKNPFPGASTHDRILRVSKNLFASRGYEHTSTSAIARTAGTSESQLMKHFGSKAGLLEAIFDAGWIEITQGAQEAATSVPLSERMPLIISQVMRHLDEDPDLKALLLIEGRRVRREGQKPKVSQQFIEFISFIEQTLSEMSEAGLLLPDTKIQVLRSAMLGMIEGMLRDVYLADGTRFPAQFTSSDIEGATRLLLASYQRPWTSTAEAVTKATHH